MKYFIDTEFIEGFHSHNGKERHHVSLISIGIVCEDDRTLYHISSDFNAAEANDWVKDNVLSKLDHSMQWISNTRIATEIKKFMEGDKDISFYGYYADYDWVVFCSLFGTMMNLPEGFPMYCRDLKQMMDEQNLSKEWKQAICPDPEGEHNALVDARWNKKLYEAIFKQSIAVVFEL